MNTLKGIDRSRETSACTVFLFIHTRHILPLHCVKCKLKNYSNLTTIQSDKDGKKIEMKAKKERASSEWMNREKTQVFAFVFVSVTYRQCSTSCSCSGVLYCESACVSVCLASGTFVLRFITTATIRAQCLCVKISQQIEQLRHSLLPH